MNRNTTPTMVNEILEIVPGTLLIANVIGHGIYEMIEHGINHYGMKYCIVRVKKLFCQGWKHRGHETTCHPIDVIKWNSLKRLK